MIAVATADVLQAYDDLFEAATLCGLLAMGRRGGGGGGERRKFSGDRSTD